MKDKIRELYVKNNVDFDELDLEISEVIIKTYLTKRTLEIAREIFEKEKKND